MTTARSRVATAPSAPRSPIPAATPATLPFAARAAAWLLPGLLAACATGTPPTPTAGASAPEPAAWQAPLPAGAAAATGAGALPHGGQLAGLRQWWTQLNDLLLVELIDAAQAASPTVASARPCCSSIRQRRPDTICSATRQPER